MQYELKYSNNKRADQQPTGSAGIWSNLNSMYKYLQDYCDIKNYDWTIEIQKETK